MAEKSGLWTLLVVGAWVWVVLATFCALGSLTDGNWGGVALFGLSAALAAPALNGFWARWLKALNPGWPALAAGIAGSLTVAAYAPGPKTGASKIAEVPSAKATKPVATPTPSEDAKRDFRQIYDKVLATAKPCDTANGEVAETLQRIGRGGASIYDAYSQANAAKGICENVVSEMSEIEVPGSFPAEAGETLKKTLDRCVSAYSLRATSLEKLLVVLDGDFRPSRTEAYKEDASTAQAGTMLCVGGLFGTGAQVGVDMAKEKGAE
jgi:hypothetical protein